MSNTSIKFLPTAKHVEEYIKTVISSRFGDTVYFGDIDPDKVEELKKPCFLFTPFEIQLIRDNDILKKKLNTECLILFEADFDELGKIAHNFKAAEHRLLQVLFLLEEQATNSNGMFEFDLSKDVGTIAPKPQGVGGRNNGYYTELTFRLPIYLDKDFSVIYNPTL